MLAIFGALQLELSGIQNLMKDKRRIKGSRFKIVIGTLSSKPVILVRTGVGKERAQDAVCHILNCYPISNILSLGFGGALNDSFEVGDLILCTKMRNTNSDHQNTFFSDDRLSSRAIQSMDNNKLRFTQGIGLTTDRVVFNPKEKMTLGLSYKAQVVDMESAWIAEIAHKRGIPILSVRSISDVRTENWLPFKVFLDDSGDFQWKQREFNLTRLSKSPALMVKTLFNAIKARNTITAFVSSYSFSLNPR
jgi:adenosylhomocysteine nucleosidase